MENEVWKNIERFPKYQVSNLGRVKSFAHNKNGKILKPKNATNGYHFVALGRDNNHYIHRLVAQAFILNPDNLPEVNHKNEIKNCNHVDNLEWCSRKYNANYGTLPERKRIAATGKVKSEETRQKIADSKFVAAIVQLTLDGEFIAEYRSSHEAERITGVSRGNIRKACKGIFKKTNGFKWMFADEYYKTLVSKIA